MNYIHLSPPLRRIAHLLRLRQVRPVPEARYGEPTARASALIVTVRDLIGKDVDLCSGRQNATCGSTCHCWRPSSGSGVAYVPTTI